MLGPGGTNMSRHAKTVLRSPGDQKLPLVALVGRPNVGKSTLFNRLTHSRRALVDPHPGMTRDRLYARVDLGEHRFRLVDTGGLDEDPDLMVRMIRQQTEAAIREADLLVLVLDGREGLLPADENIAAALRTTGRPLVGFINKVDGGEDQTPDAEFHRLGFDAILAGSAEHNLGIFDLENAMLSRLGTRCHPPALPEAPTQSAEGSDDSADPGSPPPPAAPLKLAIIGKPNVGKSSLVNRLLGEERMMVSPIAGTTRDSIDSFLRSHGRDFCLIDTAGIRRKGRIEGSQEHLSVMMAQRQVEQADVIVMLMDATDPGTQQDAAIAGIAAAAWKPIILAVNKWDLIPDKETQTPARFEERIRRKFKFLEGCPFLFLSAETGQRVSRILELASQLHRRASRRVATSEVNQFLQDLRDRQAIPVSGGRAIKIFYMTQVDVCPPTFMAVINRKPPLHFSQERFLINRVRERFDLEGIPVRILFRERSRKERS